MFKRIGLNHKGKRISFAAKRKTAFGRAMGLMFSRRKHAKILLFEFSKAKVIKIHSFFVFYPFIAVWLGRNSEVSDIKVVKPFTSEVFSEKKANSLVEIPINKRNLGVVKKFLPLADGNQKDLNISKSRVYY
jgi:uncharacterized membrane protein (UPF0127 family)